MLPPNHNDKLRPDYKKWVVDGQCMPQEAASLILGIDPVKNLTIFDHVNTAYKEPNKYLQ